MENFKVGQLFDKYSDIENLLKSNFTKLYTKKSSQTIEASRKRCPNKNYSENMKYSEVAFDCIHYGKVLTQYQIWQ